MKLRGGGWAYMQTRRGWADRCVSMVGGTGGLVPPPRNEKKDAVRGNFFHLCFTNEIRGELIHYTCKRERGCRIGECPCMWEGLGPCPPPPRNWKKKKLSEEIFIFFTYMLLHF